jgi:hypothetical protein
VLKHRLPLHLRAKKLGLNYKRFNMLCIKEILRISKCRGSVDSLFRLGLRYSEMISYIDYCLNKKWVQNVDNNLYLTVEGHKIYNILRKGFK